MDERSLFVLAEQNRVSLRVLNVREGDGGYTVHAVVESAEQNRKVEMYVESEKETATEAQLDTLNWLLLMFLNLSRVERKPAITPAKEVEETPEETEEAPKEAASKSTKKAAKKTSKKSPAKKPKGVKAVPYDRENETHKDALGDVFTSIVPGWDAEDGDEDLLNKCIELSQALVGKPFLNEKGVVLDKIVEIIQSELADFVEEEEAPKKKRSL